MLDTQSANVSIGIIGGSGLYALDNFDILGEVYPTTPWGSPSDHIVIAAVPSQPDIKIAFLARHGRGHFLSPSEVPVRANIAAFKRLGVKVILSLSAVGSLRKEIRPKDFALPSQIIDRTKGIRNDTFFESGFTSHVSFGDPFEKELADLIYEQRDVLQGEDLVFHREKTLVCIEGPAFSTRAESHMYRAWGADVINMSVLPEAKLAREAEIAYQMVCMATDYDSWKVDQEPVNVETVVHNLELNSDNAKRLLLAVIPVIANLIQKDELSCIARLNGSAVNACVTRQDLRNPAQVEKLSYLLPSLKQ